MTIVVEALEEKIIVAKIALKGIRSGIGVATFPVINKTLEDDGKNLGNRQEHHCVMSSMQNNMTKDQKTKVQELER